MRVGDRLWCQLFRDGWPVCAPFAVTGDGSGVGLMCAAALPPRYFPGLPFTREDVLAHLHPAGLTGTRVEWRPEDDLVPECPSHPRCILCPDQIESWL